VLPTGFVTGGSRCGGEMSLDQRIRPGVVARTSDLRGHGFPVLRSRVVGYSSKVTTTFSAAPGASGGARTAPVAPGFVRVHRSPPCQVADQPLSTGRTAPLM